MRLAVLGAGGWGTALARLLVHAGHEVALWTRRSAHAAELTERRENAAYLPGVQLPERLAVTDDLGKACHMAEIVVLAVPSFAMRALAATVVPHLSATTAVVHVAKGLEPDTGLRMSEVLFELLSSQPVFALCGPSHAEEVARGHPTAAVLAGASTQVGQVVQQVFMTPRFRAYLSEDLLGVEYCSVIKNVLALGTGIADGLGYGDNTRAALVTRGLAEMARFGRVVGARPETFYGLAGLGDLVVTATSRHSRNRRVGERIGSGERLERIVGEMRMVAEGVHAVPSIYTHACQLGVEMPITEAVYRVLQLGQAPADQIPALMERPPRWE